MESKCHFIMVRLTLWQLWRDCNITKSLSLIEIDDYIAENISCFVRKPYHPFEKIEIWQFLHALIEVSWRLYYWKDDEAQKNGHWRRGILATCLHEFLTHDVYPNAGNFVGLVPREYHHLLPMYSVYKLYKKIEYPPTATNILIASVKDHTMNINALPMSPITLIVPEYILNGFNCVTISEKINFLPMGEKPFIQTKMQTIQKWQSYGTKNLLLFQELGPAKIVEIMAKVCPLIKDNDSNTITNMNYSLTFLEFYEIILEVAKSIIESRKIKKVQDITSALNIELVQNDSPQVEHTSSIKTPRSVLRKNVK
ncbi:hypothetical protein KPH14_012057 [Odynerus spinipes]|uniref:Uncharacterized protein n=1 Tax=Odynerus spinipes TaxID=1348599 RepID=A0AAD9RAV8_9HYME|nr:hypothetical protein KPH14_012057 [Odynerus spinipes]